MILLVTPSLRANECAAALEEAIGEQVVVAENLSRAVAMLRAESYVAAVLDQHLLENEPDETNVVMKHLGTAIPVQVNLAISGKERLTREVRAAVHRRQHEQAAARQAAVRALYSELNETVTSLLLSCDLAMSTRELPTELRERLQTSHELVKKLRKQLQPKDE